MRKLLMMLLVVCLMVVPAYAEEVADQAGEEMTNQQENQAVVATYDELRAALDSAKDGDIIYISQPIKVNEQNSIDCNKNVIIARAENFPKSSEMIRIGHGGKVCGLNFMEDSKVTNENVDTIRITDAWSLPAIIQNCTFSSDSDFLGSYITVFGGLSCDNVVEIMDCFFTSAGCSAISTRGGVDISIKRCTFTQNRTNKWGGAIQNAGKMLLENCNIYENSAMSGGGVENSGIMTISDCYISENTISSPLYGTDILSTGKITIIGDFENDVCAYNEMTGEKVALPIENYEEILRVAYLSDEQAKEHFAPEPPQDEETEQPIPGNNGEVDTPELPEEPMQPSDGGNKDDISEQPETPPQGESGDNQPQNPEHPSEPPQDDVIDNTNSNPGETPDTPEQPVETPQAPSNQDKDDLGNVDNTPNVPQQPSEDGQGGNDVDKVPETPIQPPQTSDSNDNEHTSTENYWPIYRPIWPIVSVVDPQPQPEQQPNSTPTSAKPSLVCNGAVIDTSRTVVLLGYGDGLLHENDLLTRAQFATIIYRLLNDDTINRYSNRKSAFVDVDANAWYEPYVSVIQAAGIVNGVGGGRYDPNGYVTWEQAITVLTRFVEPQEYTLQHIQYSSWAEQAIQTAVALDWIKDSTTFTADTIISRGQLEQLINSVLTLYR